MKKNRLYGNNINIEFNKLDKSNCHSLSSFYCGNTTIDEYFRKDAINDSDATTYFFLNKDNTEIIAVFTICCSGVTYTPESEFSYVIPAIEIMYFATNEKYQKMSYSEKQDDKTLSHQLLLFCIDYIKKVPCSHCAAAILTLYAVPEYVKFYVDGGFESFMDFMEEKNKPFLQGCLPMFMFLI